MNDALESLGRVRLKGLALVVVAFAVGVLAGFAGERVRARRAFQPPDAPAFEPGAFRDGAPGRIPWFYEQLDLTDQQRTRIREIIQGSQPRTDSIMAQSMPILQAMMDSVQVEIRQVLTDEQRARLDSIAPPFRPRRMGPGRRGPFPGPRPPRPGGP